MEAEDVGTEMIQDCTEEVKVGEDAEAVGVDVEFWRWRCMERWRYI